MTTTESIEFLVLMGAGASALVAIGYLGRRAYRAMAAAIAWLRAVGALVERELTPDSGSSMKDVSLALKDHLEESGLDRADLHRRLDAVVRRARRIHPDIDWRAADRGDLDHDDRN